MIGRRSTPTAATTIALIVALTACSGSADSAPERTEVPGVIDEVAITTIATEPTSTPSTPSAAATAPSSEGPGDDPTLDDLRGALGIDVLHLEPTTETGNHPTLSWQPVDGAASYWLVLRDDDDRPYWAWTGSDTTVRVGGGDRSETNQTAALHGEMTWRVAAFDTDHDLIALSDTARLSP